VTHEHEVVATRKEMLRWIDQIKTILPGANSATKIELMRRENRLRSRLREGKEIMSDLADLLKSFDKSDKGVSVRASTLGLLEALLAFLKE